MNIHDNIMRETQKKLVRRGTLILIALVGGFTLLGIIGSIRPSPDGGGVTQGTSDLHWHAMVDYGDGRGYHDMGWTVATKDQCEHMVSDLAQAMQDQADAARQTDDNTYIAGMLVANAIRRHATCEIEP